MLQDRRSIHLYELSGPAEARIDVSKKHEKKTAEPIAKLRAWEKDADSVEKPIVLR